MKEPPPPPPPPGSLLSAESGGSGALWWTRRELRPSQLARVDPVWVPTGRHVTFGPSSVSLAPKSRSSILEIRNEPSCIKENKEPKAGKRVSAAVQTVEETRPKVCESESL